MKNSHEKEFSALGTKVYLKLVDVSAEEFERISNLVENFYRQQEKIFSRFDEKSELNLLNQNLGKFFEVSVGFLEVCRLIIDFYQKSQGYFDSRIIEFLEEYGYDRDFGRIQESNLGKKKEGKKRKSLEKELIIEDEKVCFLSRMDFSGIAKSFITQGAANLIEKNGWNNFLLDAGGDMLARGNNGEKKWMVDLEGFGSNFFLDISQKSIATSGITRRKWEKDKQKFHHLINPLNPTEFSFDLKTVTVVHRDLIQADFWAKVLFLHGLNDGIKLAKKKNIQAFFLNYSGHLYKS